MQKKVGDALYVLDLTPYVITEDTDVSIIYVQNEKMKEYKELNTELASKIHGFNQFIMTVLPRPWADGGDDPGQAGHTLTITIDRVSASFGVCGRVNANNQPSIEGNPTWLTSEDGCDDYGHETKVINNLPAGYHFQIDERIWPTGFKLTFNPVLETVIDDGLWGVGTTYVMPDSDVNVTVSVQEETVHTLRIEGYDLHSHIDVYFNGELQDLSGVQLVDGVPVLELTTIKITPKEGFSSSWFSVIQGVEWDDNEQAWVATMPDSDLVIQIDYNGQPQVAAHWEYHDYYGKRRWKHQYFVKNPRVFLPDSDQDYVGTSQWLYPVDDHNHMIPINSSEGLTVSSITSSNPLVTFDSANGKPIVSRDSNNELPYGDVTITATIHDNSGTYTDSTISYILRLVNTYKLTIDAYNNPDTGELDPSSASTTSDYIRGDFDLGGEQHRMIRCGTSGIPIDGDKVPYAVDPMEYIDLGLPAGAEVAVWFDGMASDIDTIYSVDSGEEITEHKEDHWIYFVMPESPVNMDAHWNTNSINQIVFNDTVASHNGSNIDETGSRYYYIDYYQTAPATYTNTIYYGEQADGTDYGPSDFVFSVTNAQGQSVELKDKWDGSYSFSMNSDNTPDTFTITISNPS